MLSGRGTLWMTWCMLMAAFAAGGAFTFLEWCGVHFGLAGLIANFVLFTAGYFFAYGVEAHDKEASSKRARERASIVGYKGPGFPKDPFAP